MGPLVEGLKTSYRTLMSPDGAEELSESLLASALPRRWAHVQEVGRRAKSVLGLGGEGNVLVASAWIHDIGYAPEIAIRGFHPLDGAIHLRRIGAPERIAGLVAFHSSAASEAEVLGVGDELAAFQDERTLTRDLLWYLDTTTSPDGAIVRFEDRMAELRQRYPADHYVIRALDLGMPERVAAVERAEAWLASVGLAGQV